MNRLGFIISAISLFLNILGRLFDIIDGGFSIVPKISGWLLGGLEGTGIVSRINSWLNSCGITLDFICFFLGPFFSLVKLILQFTEVQFLCIWFLLSKGCCWAWYSSHVGTSGRFLVGVELHSLNLGGCENKGDGGKGGKSHIILSFS